METGLLQPGDTVRSDDLNQLAQSNDSTDSLDDFLEYKSFRELENLVRIEKRVKKKTRWKKRYQTGIPIVDQQHKSFFILVRTVEKLVNQKNKSEKIVKLALDEIVNHVVTHFKTEEIILKEIGYPDVEGHAKIHQTFAREVSEKVLQFNLFKIDVLDMEFLEYLEKWLLEHILVEDFTHCQYTKKKLALQKDNEKIKQVIAAGPPTSNFGELLKDATDRRAKSNQGKAIVKRRKAPLVLRILLCGTI